MNVYSILLQQIKFFLMVTNLKFVIFGSQKLVNSSLGEINFFVRGRLNEFTQSTPSTTKLNFSSW